MDYIQESFAVISSPSRENRTSQDEITPKNLNNSSKSNLCSSYDLLKTPNSNPSYEDPNLFCETKKTSTPQAETFLLVGGIGCGKSTMIHYFSRKYEKLTIDFTENSSWKNSIEQLCDGTNNYPVKELNMMMRNRKEDMASIIKEQFSKIFTEKLNGLQSLKLDCFRSKVATECIDFFDKERLSNLRSLKKLELNLWGSDITNLSIQRFAWNIKHLFGELEEFHLNLGQTQVTEKVMIQFFHEMPKMKHFEMRVGNCTFSDYGLKIFLRNTLPSMKSLETFSFQLEGTKISSSQIQDLFKNLPEALKKLSLDLRWTRICDDAFEYFLKGKLPILKNLIEVEFKIDCTPLSDRISEEVEKVNRKYARKIDYEGCSEYLKTLRFEENLLKSLTTF